MKLKTEKLFIISLQLILLIISVSIYLYYQMNHLPIETETLWKGVLTTGFLAYKIIRYFADQVKYKDDDDVNFYMNAEEDYFIHKGKGRKYFRKGLRLILRYKIKPAEQCFETALTEADNSKDKSIVYYFIGLCLSANDLEDEGIISYQQAVEIYPGNIRAWRELGLNYELMEEHEKAILCYENALEQNERDYIAMLYIGISYISLREYNRAIAILERAYNIKPDHLNINKHLAVAYACSGNRYKAEDALERVKRSGEKRKKRKELKLYIEELLEEAENI